ncbi:MAG: 3-dehydroquinate synthase [Pseudomonadota bacterium]
MTHASATVHVELGARSYDILVGANLISQPTQALSALVENKRCAIVTDSHVASIHLPAFKAMLAPLCVSADAIIVPAGESSKSFAQLEDVCSQLLDLKLTRRDMIIALGGGVIGDLTGFAASIVRRGIDFIQAPTTLLAQVDSSVGGKTGINVPQGKNLIGAFYQPKLVLADTGCIKTLPERERKAGFAEVLKYGLINDRPFFDWLRQHGQRILDNEADAVTKAVAHSCQNKADVVAQDEREGGVRALLNLGHTFGHAIEAHGGYDGRVLHGEAISVGMVMAHQVSHALGLLSDADLNVMLSTFETLKMPMTMQAFDIPDLTPAQMVQHMTQDKKNIDSRITLILTRGIGEAFLTRDVDARQLETLIVQVFERGKAGAL